MNGKLVLPCSVTDLLETMPFHSIHSENQLSSWASVQFITESKRLTDAWANLNCKFNFSPSLEFSLIQFNWMHPEALDCKMQSHHVISLRSLCVHQQLSNIFTKAWLWGAFKARFFWLSFSSSDDHLYDDFNDIFRLCVHPVKCVCVCMHVSEMLHCVFIAPSLCKQRTLVWKTWCMKEAVSGLCRTVRLSGVKGVEKREQPEKSSSSFPSYAS